MFRKLTSLFFGRDEETPKDQSQRTSKPGDMVEEEWLLVSHHEAVSEGSTVEDQAVELANASVYRCPSLPPVSEESEPSLGNDVRRSEPEVPVQRSHASSRALRGSMSHAGALAKVTQVARVQRAQARSVRRHLGRAGIQRQNCIRQRAHRHSARSCTNHLHQPAKRSFSH